MTSSQNVDLTKWCIDRMMIGQVDVATKWCNDKMTSWLFIELAKWHIDRKIRWLNDELTKWRNDKLSNWQTTSWPKDLAPLSTYSCSISMIRWLILLHSHWVNYIGKWDSLLRIDCLVKVNSYIFKIYLHTTYYKQLQS